MPLLKFPQTALLSSLDQSDYLGFLCKKEMDLSVKNKSDG